VPKEMYLQITVTLRVSLVFQTTLPESTITQLTNASFTTRTQPIWRWH